MRIATRAGRTVLVSPDSATVVDLAKASEGAFGPDPRQVFDAWEELVSWYGAATVDFVAGDRYEFSELEAPSPDPRQVFAIGLNYRDHADESGLTYPEKPTVFTKFLGSFAGPAGDLALAGETVDWEAELVVVIGKPTRYVAAEDAWSHVAGLTVGQDFSERTFQLTGPAPQFSLGKSFVGFAPQGPWLVTPDELPDPDRLSITCTVNGETVQSGSTDQLIFPVSTLISHLSFVLELSPGDVIFTGTPSGVGGARKPPWFLREGDVVETTIEGIGTMRHVCVKAQ
ncbi:fumarylacetoacetate hydrolase family protein [Streptomyces luteolifulvus]|uniref:Fumarylacetoacetate hydrolase family protein n=1 Tax=Streptomyces luteolifulvus TaxID=2615112 RepID=A0A6H9UMZ9_9ACTN|nr:fumarylacetoacetate hydrolase family protein [Streptomyces luteolifulvus]KAB1138953.1 fumarylacetoacetate hydrolase family protein [Streptomyces luteolifulvus]